MKQGYFRRRLGKDGVKLGKDGVRLGYERVKREKRVKCG
jgi:hypothetical protein